MFQHTTSRTRATAIAFAFLAISSLTVGAAQASRIIEVAPSLLAPAPADIAVTHLVTSAQAANVHAELQDIRSQLANHK